MNEKAAALQARTHVFFVGVIRFCDSVPHSPAGQSIIKQLIDAAGAVDSYYRAACKARSKKEFIARVGVAAEEADESVGWLMALREVGMGEQATLEALLQEANELTAIFVQSGKTATNRLEAEKRRAARKRRAR